MTTYDPLIDRINERMRVLELSEEGTRQLEEARVRRRRENQLNEAFTALLGAHARFNDSVDKLREDYERWKAPHARALAVESEEEEEGEHGFGEADLFDENGVGEGSGGSVKADDIKKAPAETRIVIDKSIIRAFWKAVKGREINKKFVWNDDEVIGKLFGKREPNGRFRLTKIAIPIQGDNTNSFSEEMEQEILGSRDNGRRQPPWWANEQSVTSAIKINHEAQVAIVNRGSQLIGNIHLHPSPHTIFMSPTDRSTQEHLQGDVKFSTSIVVSRTPASEKGSSESLSNESAVANGYFTAYRMITGGKDYEKSTNVDYEDTLGVTDAAIVDLRAGAWAWQKEPSAFSTKRKERPS